MSTDLNHKQATTSAAHNISTFAVLPPFLLILAFQAILFHIILAEGYNI